MNKLRVSIFLYVVYAVLAIALSPSAKSDVRLETAYGVGYSLGVCTGLHQQLFKSTTEVYAKKAMRLSDTEKLNKSKYTFAMFWAIFGEGRAFRYRVKSIPDTRNQFYNQWKCELLLTMRLKKYEDK